MKKRLPLILIAILLIAIRFQANSQTYVLERSVFGAGGSAFMLNTTDSTSLSGILGQLAIESLTGTNSGILHQGFWVPADTILGVEDNPISLTKQLGNYPNPFSTNTTIKYTLPGNGFVTLKIYDNVGRIRKILVNEFQAQGPQEIVWDGKDEEGIDCASGSYIYELTALPNQSFGAGSFTDINLRNMMVIVR